MYVCICNAIRESEISTVIAEGVTDVDEVYARLGAEPQCRSCEGCIETMIALVPVPEKLDAA